MTAPPSVPFGPSVGVPTTRSSAGPQIPVGEPTGTYTTLNPNNSFATNQSQINGAGTGATIWWPKGTYRLSGTDAYAPLTGQTWLFETPPKGVVKNQDSAAIIKGSVSVDNWVADGTGLWYATGQTQNYGDGTTRTGDPAYQPLFYTEREDYWLDSDTADSGTILWPVATKAELYGTHNRRWFDHANGVIWIGFDPTGHVIERGWRPSNAYYLVAVSAVHDVLIRGGVFEHNFGTTIGMAASVRGVEYNIRLEHCTMRMTHSQILTGWGDFADENQAPDYDPTFTHKPTGMSVTNCYLGWGGTYANTIQRFNELTFDRNELAYNNWGPSAAHNIDDEGVQKNGNILDWSTYNYNWVHHNNSSVWWDTQPHNSLQIRENVFEDNPMGFAIMLEDVSGPISVYRNYFKDNGYARSDWTTHSGAQGNYHYEPSVDYDRVAGHIRLNATNAAEVSYNDFDTTSTNAEQLQHKDIEIGYQDRSTCDGPVNTWIHHNRHKRRMGLGSQWKYTLYKGFTASDTGTDGRGHRDIDNNKWDYNEYHVPNGATTTAAWFNRGSNITWAAWQAGCASSWGGTGAGADHYDPNSTLTGDL